MSWTVNHNKKKNHTDKWGRNMGYYTLGQFINKVKKENKQFMVKGQRIFVENKPKMCIESFRIIGECRKLEYVDTGKRTNYIPRAYMDKNKDTGKLEIYRM